MCIGTFFPSSDASKAAPAAFANSSGTSTSKLRDAPASLTDLEHSSHKSPSHFAPHSLQICSFGSSESLISSSTTSGTSSVIGSSTGTSSTGASTTGSSVTATEAVVSSVFTDTSVFPSPSTVTDTEDSVTTC